MLLRKTIMFTSLLVEPQVVLENPQFLLERSPFLVTSGQYLGRNVLSVPSWSWNNSNIPMQNHHMEHSTGHLYHSYFELPGKWYSDNIGYIQSSTTIGSNSTTYYHLDITTSKYVISHTSCWYIPWCPHDIPFF